MYNQRVFKVGLGFPCTTAGHCKTSAAGYRAQVTSPSGLKINGGRVRGSRAPRGGSTADSTVQRILSNSSCFFYSRSVVCQWQLAWCSLPREFCAVLGSLQQVQFPHEGHCDWVMLWLPAAGGYKQGRCVGCPGPSCCILCFGQLSLYIEVMSVTRKANTLSRGSPVFVPSAVTASGGYEESVGPGRSGTIWSARKGGRAFVSPVLWESGSQCSESRCSLFEELLKITLGY